MPPILQALRDQRRGDVVGQVRDKLGLGPQRREDLRRQVPLVRQHVAANQLEPRHRQALRQKVGQAPVDLDGHHLRSQADQFLRQRPGARADLRKALEANLLDGSGTLDLEFARSPLVGQASSCIF